VRDGTVAYVDLRDVELAKKFMASHDRKPLEILGRLVRVDYASPSAGHMQAWTPPPADLASPHVVIGDIPLGADDESHLRERLAAALKVLGPAPPLEVELVRDNNGAFIGCAHARYESAQAAQAALDAACDAPPAEPDAVRREPRRGTHHCSGAPASMRGPARPPGSRRRPVLCVPLVRVQAMRR
jgi:hypothetical protein